MAGITGGAPILAGGGRAATGLLVGGGAGGFVTFARPVGAAKNPMLNFRFHNFVKKLINQSFHLCFIVFSEKNSHF